MSAVLLFILSFPDATAEREISGYICISAAVLAIGIIDRLGYDFLIMHDEIPLQYNIFISTIGNVNFWAGYLSIIIPFFMLAVLFTKNRFARFFIYLLFACSIFQSVYHADKYDLHRNWHCSIICCMVFTLQSQSSEKIFAINGILFAIAGGIAEVLWKHPCTPRAIDTDSVSKLLFGTPSVSGSGYSWNSNHFAVPAGDGFSRKNTDKDGYMCGACVE